MPAIWSAVTMSQRRATIGEALNVWVVSTARRHEFFAQWTAVYASSPAAPSAASAELKRVNTPTSASPSPRLGPRALAGTATALAIAVQARTRVRSASVAARAKFFGASGSRPSTSQGSGLKAPGYEHPNLVFVSPPVVFDPYYLDRLDAVVSAVRLRYAAEHAIPVDGVTICWRFVTEDEFKVRNPFRSLVYSLLIE